jgi:hypothetical protein
MWMCRLDSKPYIDKVRRASELADKALAHYSEPVMSLEELRETLRRELKGISLSELIIKEREAGW